MDQITIINSASKGKIVKKTFYYRIALAQFIAIISLGLLFSGCSTTSTSPALQINAAEQSLIDAEQARVAEYALPEMQDARVKISGARTAVQNKNSLLAQRLAEQASVDIRLATAKSELAKEQAANKKIKKNIHVLKQEMNRNTGDQQ